MTFTVRFEGQENVKYDRSLYLIRQNVDLLYDRLYQTHCGKQVCCCLYSVPTLQNLALEYLLRRDLR